MKKFLLLILCLVSSLVASAESGTCGKNLTWTLKGGVLTISGTGEMTDYGYPTNVPWYSSRYTITQIVISEGVTSIGKFAFSGCRDFTSITIPNSVTSIGYNAFGGCRGLTSVTIPNSVTSIGNEVFCYCSGLTSVTIGNSVTSIGYAAFDGCSGLTSITIPNSVTSIGSEAFEYCRGLTSITIPNSVTSIGSEAFSGCSGLTSVAIGNSVTSIGERAFDGCSNVSKLVYAEGCTTALRTYLTSITSVSIPNSVTSIGNSAFSGCSALTSVTIPNSVTSIGHWAFENCSALTSITIPNSVASIGNYAFSGCSGLTSVNVSCKDIDDFCNYIQRTDISSIFYTTGLSGKDHSIFIAGELQTSIAVPNSVTSIRNYAFSGCRSLTSVKIPNSVTSIGERAFSGCYIRQDKFVNNSSCNSADNWGATLCDEETADGLIIKDNVAIKCRPWTTSITIPNSVTSIRNYAFSGCRGLTSITIPNSVTSIGSSAFDGCSGLTSVNITDLASWCNISFGSYDANPTYYAHKLVLNGTEIKDLVIPEGFTEVRNYTFCGCSGLTSVTIPNSVTSIGSESFKGCSRLTSVTIPNSVTSIGSKAFYQCSALKSLRLEGINTTMTVSDDYKFKIYVHTPSITHLNLLRQKYKYLYSLESGSKTAETTYFSSVSGGYTRARANFVNLMSGYDWTTKIGEKGTLTPVADNSCSYKVEKAGTYTIYLYAKYKDATNYLMDQIDVTIKDIESFVQNYKVTGSSITPINSIAEELEQEGAADVRCTFMIWGGTSMSGLEPNTEYSVCRNIHCDAFDKTLYDQVRTASIAFTTAPAKVINMGNVIISATTNVDEEETNVGFEWRRQDWSSLNPSNFASAPIYDGHMEGYIRNVYTGAQWKYRPYYRSNSGREYYGEWMGFDPTNTSYFEPTVYTYDRIEVAGNTALVKGYAMRGTDDIVSQGFHYWKSVNASTRSMKVPSMNDVMTVEAKGQVMTAVLPDLEYETTYCYQAFVTTAESTIEGEIRMFTTGEDLSGIAPIQIEDKELKVIGYYDLNGRAISAPARGLSIVRYSDGSSRRIIRR